MSAADRIARRRMESCVLSRSPPTTAVTIRNAYKQYRRPKTVVFEGLNLTVPRGTIYCLLGPSGCGKTTLLNCIAGQSHLDSGSITLSISRRSEMGFMPQTVSLYQNLSVYENFFVFGYLVGMCREDIKSRATQLIKFLNIPSGTRQVKTFSGGEQRRVSVAVTFLHDPKLLILDEPTVGLDPLLCQGIWDYMLELSSKGKTILITTHYIQEARQAHTIGLMRHGILLAEDKPSNLLIRFNTDDLEEVFFKLSLQQKIQTKEITQNDEVRSQSVRVRFEEDDSCFSNTKFSACNYKNIMILKRAFVFVIFLFVLPFSQIIFFNLTIGIKPKYLQLAVVNDEFPTMFCDSTSYKGCFLDNTENLTLSCLYLETLQTDFYQYVNYNDTESALNDVRKNKVWALLYFPHNYTASLAERYSFGTQASPDAITSSNIEAWIDLSDQYIGNFIKYDTARHSTRFLERAFENCGRNRKLGAPPLSMEEPIFGSYDEEFITYAATATLCVVCFFMPFLLTGGLVFVEKAGGITERLLITGISLKELFASILMYQIIIHIIQTIGVLCITYYVFGNPLKGSVVTLTTLLVLVGMVGSLFGLVVAAVSSSIFFVACSGIGSNLLLIITSVLVSYLNRGHAKNNTYDIILSGTSGVTPISIAWPQEAQHYSLKAISAFIPLTLVVEASRAICAKSFPLTHPTVMKGFISAFGWGLVFLLLLTLVLKYKKNAWSAQSS